jgi:adenosylcobinamide-phosphate synthase
LILEQAVAVPADNPVYVFATALSDTTARQFNAGRPRHGVYAWIALIGAAVALTGAVFYLARSIHWIAALAVDVAVLYFAFGFRQFSHPLTRIQAALEAGDVETARQLLVQLKRRSDPGFRAGDLSPGEIARQAIDFGLLEAHRHVFGVLFWFVLLPGPVGAVMYRLADFVSRQWNPRPAVGTAALPADRFGEFAAAAFRVIDWVPARLTALGFAIVGDFEGAVYCWRRIVSTAPTQSVSSRVLILARPAGRLIPRAQRKRIAQYYHESGHEGAGLGDPDSCGMRSAVALVWRSLLLWMILLLLLTAVAVFGY